MVAKHELSDMSAQEFRLYVESIVDDRLRTGTRPYKQQSDRPLAEVIREMKEILVESQPGDPSVVEMIREDRDR